MKNIALQGLVTWCCVSVWSTMVMDKVHKTSNTGCNITYHHQNSLELTGSLFTCTGSCSTHYSYTISCLLWHFCMNWYHAFMAFFVTVHWLLFSYLQHIYICSTGADNWWYPDSSIGRCSPVGEGKQHSGLQDEWCGCCVYNVDKPQEDRWNGSWSSWHPQRKGGKF